MIFTKSMSVTPPNKRITPVNGKAANTSKNTKDKAALIFPKIIFHGDISVQRSKSKVCRSLSPLMDVAVKIGRINNKSPNWKLDIAA